jgi:hypothetical protein
MTFGNSTNLASAADCTDCDRGHACIIGSVVPQPCSTGTYQDLLRQEECKRCETGKYQDAPGATACIDCAPGHWCSLGQQTACTANTFNPLPNAAIQTNCTRCPERATTHGRTARTSFEDCNCISGFYFAPEDHAEQRMADKAGSCVERCCTCPPGVDCDNPNASITITLASLPLKRGYYRRLNSTVDIRRCPDAAASCAGKSECEQSSSGCQGGNDVERGCLPGLMGIFCRECVEDGHYYVAARSGAAAHCDSCVGVFTSSGFLLAVILLPLGAAVACGVLAVRMSKEKWQQRLVRAWPTLTRSLGIANKLKLTIGFFQIVTRVHDVYDIMLPNAVRKLLQAIAFTISLGVEGIPLECMGAKGYVARLVLWVLVPLMLVMLVTLVQSARLLRQRRFAVAKLARAVAPVALRLLFLLYPIITNQSFEAFSCYTFDDGSRWLISDVSIQCDTSEHTRAVTLAWLAVAIYPIGCFILNGCLLTAARWDIRARRKTPLTEAISFLYSEFERQWYAWELCEMGRRLVLVGFLVVGPFDRGSMMQLATATLICIVYLVTQVLASPVCPWRLKPRRFCQAFDFTWVGVPVHSTATSRTAFSLST